MCPFLLYYPSNLTRHALALFLSLLGEIQLLLKQGCHKSELYEEVIFRFINSQREGHLISE